MRECVVCGVFVRSAGFRVRGVARAHFELKPQAEPGERASEVGVAEQAGPP